MSEQQSGILLTTGRNRFFLFGTIYAISWLATWYSARLLEVFGAVSLCFLPGGLRFFCLFALGWLGFALEVSTLCVLLTLQFVFADPGAPDTSAWSQLLGTAYNLFVYAIAYAVAVIPLRRKLGRSIDFSRTTDSVMFVGAALVASALAATAGASRLVYTGVVAGDQWPSVFSNWLLGDFIGIVTLAPFLIVVVQPHLKHYLRHGLWDTPLRTSDLRADATHNVTAISLVLCTFFLLFFLPHFFGVTRQPPLVALLLLLPLATVALRSNIRVTTFAILILETGLVLSVAVFGQRELAGQYQLVMVAIAIVGLWLGGTEEARNRLFMRLQDISSISNDLIWESDAHGVVRFSSKVSGESAATDVSWHSSFALSLWSHLGQFQNAHGQHQAFRDLELTLQTGLGTPHWISVSGMPFCDEVGEYAGHRGTATDISDRVRVKTMLEAYNQQLIHDVSARTSELHQKNQELTNKEQHLRVLLASVPVGVLEFNDEGRCLYINANGSLLTGCSLEEDMPLHVSDFVQENDRDTVEQAWRDRTHSNGVNSVAFRINRRNTLCSAHLIRFHESDDRSARTIMVLIDTTAQHQHEQELWSLAHTDLLTGLPNRHLFLDRCAQALSLAKRNALSIAIFWIDLDEFKAVNDTLGHAAGDALLQQVALRLKSSRRDSDTVARIGGDEFAMVMVDVASAESAQQIASQLVTSLKQPYQLPCGVAHVSASIGIAMYPQNAATVETLMSLADTAMYSAKHAGKNQCKLFEDPASAPTGSA